MVTASVVAVNTAAPTVVDVTVKVTTPEVLEGPEAAEIASIAPRLEARVTVSPATAAPALFVRATVIVEVLVPLAVTEAGEADTLELAALAPAANVTLAV
jgi:hypothetical protein